MSTIAEELKKLREAQDGGNPNYVETIEGTAANPWGDIDPAELRVQLANNTATARITAFLSELGGNFPDTTLEYSTMCGSEQLFFMVMNFINGSPSSGGFINYNVDGRLVGAGAYVAPDSIDMSEYASVIRTNLTIIHHPLPEAGS